MKFLLDTNFLMIPGMFKLNIFEMLQEFDAPNYYTLDLIVEELKKLSKSRRKKSGYATMALHSLRKEDVHIIPVKTKMHADNAIVRIADNDFIVCTQDKALIKKLKRKKVRIVTLRQKRYLREV